MAHALPTRGRLLQVKRGTSPGTLIAGVRTKSISINGEPIDITNDDDVGWRKLLDQPGEVTVEISVAGVLKGETLIQESVSTSDRMQAMSFEWPGAATPGSLVGDFFLSAFSITGEYQGAATFEATFISSGAIAFTAAV
jgi:TP901-1 family phage major tail protein